MRSAARNARRPDTSSRTSRKRRRRERASAKTHGVVIGVISDTHGLLRPEALRALRGVDFIIHAGDVGTPEVLTGLRKLAPVRAVRGNNDHGPWAERLPERRIVRAGRARLLVLHDIHYVHELLKLRAVLSVDAVISGHSHQPVITRRDGVLYLNPGSAGPRRFRLPIALARLRVRDKALRARIVELDRLILATVRKR